MTQTPGEMLAEKKRILYRWMVKAFDAGQKVDRYSDQASEFYYPMIDFDWVPKILAELAVVHASGEYTEVMTERLREFIKNIGSGFWPPDVMREFIDSKLADLQAKDGRENDS